MKHIQDSILLCSPRVGSEQCIQQVCLCVNTYMCMLIVQANCQPVHGYMCRLNVQANWAEIAELNLRGTFTKEAQQHLLWDRSLGLPSWSDDDWQRIANSSLPAALQYHIWPADITTSLRSQVSPIHTSASSCSIAACEHRSMLDISVLRQHVNIWWCMESLRACVHVCVCVCVWWHKAV